MENASGIMDSTAVDNMPHSTSAEESSLIPTATMASESALQQAMMELDPTISTPVRPAPQLPDPDLSVVTSAAYLQNLYQSTPVQNYNMTPNYCLTMPRRREKVRAYMRINFDDGTELYIKNPRVRFGRPESATTIGFNNNGLSSGMGGYFPPVRDGGRSMKRSRNASSIGDAD